MVDIPAERGSRTISDARTLKALSHPVRLALMEALMAGPLTATQAGELIGESPTTCSFHLRQLARYGLVKEAGGGRGRARPWRLTHARWDVPARPEDAEFTRAVQELDHLVLDRLYTRIRRFVDTAATYPSPWQHAAASSTSVLHLTPAELSEITAAYQEMIKTFHDRYAERTEHPEQRPPGALPVEILFMPYPIDGGRR